MYSKTIFSTVKNSMCCSTQSKVKHDTFSQGNVKSINNIIGPKNMPPNCKQQNTVQHFLIQNNENKQLSKQWVLLGKTSSTLLSSMLMIFYWIYRKHYIHNN